MLAFEERAEQSCIIALVHVGDLIDVCHDLGDELSTEKPDDCIDEATVQLLFDRVQVLAQRFWRGERREQVAELEARAGLRELLVELRKVHVAVRG